MNLLTQGEVFATREDAAAKERRQPALTADRKTRRGFMWPLCAPALETSSMTWDGVYELTVKLLPMMRLSL